MKKNRRRHGPRATAGPIKCGSAKTRPRVRSLLPSKNVDPISSREAVPRAAPCKLRLPRPSLSELEVGHRNLSALHPDPAKRVSLVEAEQAVRSG